MGTNYYGMIIPTENDKESIIEFVRQGQFSKAYELFPQRVHLGKSSAGWEFLFNHNNWEYFSKNIGTIKAFFSRVQIVDEYDKEISQADFWELVERKKGGLHYEEYMNQWDDIHPGMSRPYYSNEKLDFLVDGLRFSTSAEFS